MKVGDEGPKKVRLAVRAGREPTGHPRDFPTKPVLVTWEPRPRAARARRVCRAKVIGQLTTVCGVN